MIVNYANYHNWYKEISLNPLDDFGGKNKKRIESTLEKIHEYNIRYTIEKIDDAFLDWFIPFYEKKIGAKDNPNIYDIRSIIAEKAERIDYYSLGLFENDVPIGGTIFSDRGDRYSYGYRVYEYDWLEARLPATPTFYTEYILAKHSLENGKKKLSHGKDRNPYGVNSGIGLCTFKLSVGCMPKLPKTYETFSLDTGTVTENVLVLEKPQNGNRITDAHLCVKESEQEKYVQALKYPDLLKVHTHVR